MISLISKVDGSCLIGRDCDRPLKSTGNGLYHPVRINSANSTIDFEMQRTMELGTSAILTK